MWSHDTTSQVIEWLFEFNSFFGLQGESEYYRALSQRVLHLAEHYGNRDAESVNPTASLGKYREQVPAAPAQSCSSSSSVPLSNNISLETPKSTASPVRPAMQPQPHHLVITGHSLGGGLARIVGALTGQASVSFGPPGLGLSYRKYSIENANASKLKSGHTIKISSKGQLDHQSLAIVTAFDVVTQIDQQVGLIQNIQCDHQDKAFHNAACHLLEGTICHLLKHCGDAKNRFVTCDSKFDVAVLGPSISAFLWHYKYLTVPLVLMVICFVLLAVIPAVV